MSVPRFLRGGCLALVTCFAGCGSSENGGGGGTGGAVGGGGSGGVAGSSGTGGALGCVDIAVSPKLLDDAAQWFAQAASPLSGNLWRTSKGIHYAWAGYRLYTSGQYLSNTMQWLIVSTFQPETGSLIRNDVYRLMPDGLTADFTGVRSFAGRDDGTFVVGYDYAENKKLPARVSIGRLGEAEVYKTIVVPANPDPTLIALNTAAGWDGEAFAVHAYGAPPQFTLHVARLDGQGSALLPFTQFGQTGEAALVGYLLEHRTSTNAKSGRTFVFDVPQVTAHDRAGVASPFSPTVLAPPGAPEGILSTGAVAADDSGGAWFVYSRIGQIDRALEIVHVDPKAAIDRYFEARPPKSDIGHFRVQAVAAREDRGLIASATHYGVYSLSADASGASEPTLLVGGLNAEHDLRDMELIDSDGETWLSYSENGAKSYLRILKVAPGCVYPAYSPNSP